MATVAVSSATRQQVAGVDPASAPVASPRPSRLTSVDAYRGLVMVLMLGEVWRSCDVSAALPGSRFWGTFCYEQTHAAWTGASLHDLIQPGFYFLVGIALLFSTTRRRSQGESGLAILSRVLVRSVVLILLGMTLRAMHPRTWQWIFDDTLSQIGLAYPFLFAIASRPRRDWYVAFVAILVGYWLWFALTPLPPAQFDSAAVAVPPEWLDQHGLTGFQAHWQKNHNVAFAFDLWFLNLFPQHPAYSGTVNGLATLNFIPSIATMLLGVFAGDLLRSTRTAFQKAGWLAVAGVLLICAGWSLGAAGIVPVVKAIWTPSWVLFSGGWCCLFLAAFHVMAADGRRARLLLPLTIVGMNSLVAYVLSHAFPSFASNSFRRILGSSVFGLFGAAYDPFVYGCLVFAAYWSLLYILYRRRILLRI